jgi:hypothetical protein
MVVEYIRYRVDPTQRENFIQAFAHIVKQIDVLPNCLGYDLMECMDDPALFVLRVEWTAMTGRYSFTPSSIFPGLVEDGSPFPDQVLENHYYKQTGVSKRK